MNFSHYIPLIFAVVCAALGVLTALVYMGVWPQRESKENAPEPKLIIHRAVYAAGLPTEVSVTKQLIEIAREGVVVTLDDKLGGLLLNDPAFGVPKRLDVEYSYGSDTRFRVSRCERPGEIVRLVLPEDSEVGRLTGALRIKDAECAQLLQQGITAKDAEIERLNLAQRPQVMDVAELIIEYRHSCKPGETDGNGNRPLTIKNVTGGKSAFNVCIAPLWAEHCGLRFRPEVVTCIEGGKSAEFNGCEDDMGIAMDTQPRVFIPNHFAHFLSGFYKDSENEQFEWKSITLEVNYESGGVPVTAECEIKYRRWHEEVTTGAHRIRQRKAI